MTIQLYITQYGSKYYYLKITQDSNFVAYSIYNQKLILFLLLPVMIPVETLPPSDKTTTQAFRPMHIINHYILISLIIIYK